jgi:hypothetical protein
VFCGTEQGEPVDRRYKRNGETDFTNPNQREVFVDILSIIQEVESEKQQQQQQNIEKADNQINPTKEISNDKVSKDWNTNSEFESGPFLQSESSSQHKEEFEQKPFPPNHSLSSALGLTSQKSVSEDNIEIFIKFLQFVRTTTQSLEQNKISF